MEYSRALIVLWQRRRWVAVGALVAAVAALLSVYRVGLFPPSLEGRTNVFSTASTEILVDTPSSAFADVASDLDPLETRASVFARFLTSPTAIQLIARKSRLPGDAIEAQGPYDLNEPTFSQGPTAEQRSSQIIGEGAVYRLRFENNPILPIVAVFAQAPNTREAVKLATAAGAALRAYVTKLQIRHQTPTNRRVEIRQLGKAVGGVVNRGANIEIATLVFLVVFGSWCLLLIPARTVAQGWREAREADLWRGNEFSGGNGGSNGRGESLPQSRTEREPAG
jgi:hypothetical protein